MDDRKQTVRLRATSNGATRTSANITRWFLSPAVTIQVVGENGLVGRFYKPPGNGPHPGVMALHGSSPQILDAEAGLLASHGYATLALQYFGAEGLSPTLSEIPLGYFETAMEWLTDRKTVANDGIGLLGGSRGGELALLLGSRESKTAVKVVIGYVPSAHVFASNYGGTSAWAVDGKPVQYIPLLPYATTIRYSEEGKRILRPLYRTAVKKADAKTKKKATIHVENIDGSVLLISGQDDAMWPSTPFSRKVVERLNTYGHSHPYDHLSYENAGHSILHPYIPTTGSTETEEFVLGGTPAGNANAAADSWPRVLEYLEKALAPIADGRH